MPRINDIDLIQPENRIGSQKNQIQINNRQAKASFRSKKILNDSQNKDILNTQRIQNEINIPIKGDLNHKSEKNILISQKVVKEQKIKSGDGNCFSKYF